MFIGKIIIRKTDARVNENVLGSSKGYHYSNLYNSSDEVFASLTSLVDWGRDNLGKSKGSASNGGSAAQTTYDNTTSGLFSIDVQSAIDEVVENGGVLG